jgi:hypothetical protein
MRRVPNKGNVCGVGEEMQRRIIGMWNKQARVRRANSATRFRPLVLFLVERVEVANFIDNVQGFGQ